MALTTNERNEVAREFVQRCFVEPNRIAHTAFDAIVTAISTFDNALDTNVSVLAFLGTDTLLTSLIKILPDPFRTNSNAAQKAMLASLVFLKRAGVL